MEKSLAVNFKLEKWGFQVKVFSGKKYFVKYQPGIFDNFPEAGKKFLLANFIYARTRALALEADYSFNYQTPKPYLKNFIDWGIKSDLGRLSNLNNLPTKKLLKKISASEEKINFTAGASISRLPIFNASSAKNAVLALSFGKDSLLSYGVSKEIGLNLTLAVDLDSQNYSKKAWRERQQIFSSFARREKQALSGFFDNIDTILTDPEISNPLNDLENINGMLAFYLELMPLAYHNKAQYLIFGNEQNLNDYYFNADSYKSYPSFDQSAFYIKKLNHLLKRLTNNKLAIASLVEPIYNLAEMFVLYSRYPRLLQYIMSCYPKSASHGRWCASCPMCAKIFLYAAASGGDPAKMKLSRSMFKAKDRQFYPLLAAKITRPYEKPAAVREEQLLAFLLAYQSGWRGPLIDLFRKKYLAEAKRKEKNLRRKYLGIHTAVSLPKSIKEKVLAIYHKELDYLL